MVTATQARQTVSRFRDDPAFFMREVLGATLYDKEVEIVEAVRDSGRTAVVGANSSGKDYTAGRILLWWQTSYYPAITVIIGPTHRQVSDIVWKEARSAYLTARYPLGGNMHRMARWEVDSKGGSGLDPRHYAVGFATADEFNIQGFHSPNLLVIITEAHAVEQSHMDAIKRLNPTRILMTGNALTSAGEFHSAFHETADLYHGIHISAFDTPNVKEKRVVIPGMITWEQVQERKREWGEESALYVASILGRFPDNLEDAVVPRSLLMEAVQRTIEGDGNKTLSCDVARFGEDKTVVYLRDGNRCKLVWKIQGRDTQQVAGKCLLLAEEYEVETIVVDDTGVGGGVTDRLKEETSANQDRPMTLRIIPFSGGSAAHKPERYANAITEAWMELAKVFKDGMIDIDDNPSLIAQLSSRRYVVQGDRRLKLESKDEYKKRAKASPDDADSLAMAYAPTGGRPGLRFLE